MKKAIEYSVIVCLVSWVAAGIFYFASFRSAADDVSAVMARQVFSIFYMFIPMITAMLLQRFRYRDKFLSTGLMRFRVTGSWFVAWVIVPVICALSIAFAALVPGVTFSWTFDAAADVVGAEQWALMNSQIAGLPLSVVYISIIFSSMLAGATINAIAAFGEEYGWRNYMVRALHHYKFWKVCLIIGFVWGIWHFPLILMGHNYPSNPVLGVPMMVLFCMAISIPILYFTLKARSVIVAAVMHGTLNATAGMSMMMLSGGNNFTTGIVGWPGIAAMLVVSAGLFVYDRYVSRENIFTSTIECSLHRGEAPCRPE